MRKSLIKTLIEAYKTWKKEQSRYSWLFCPLCNHDLNGDDKSFVRESKNHMFWHYKCDRCGSKSKWHLYGPVPLPTSYQKLERKLSVYNL
jgi:hypothetical protein